MSDEWSGGLLVPPKRKAYRLSTGKDGAEEYVPPRVVNYLRKLEEEIDKTKVRAIIHEPKNQKDITGSMYEVVNEITILQMVFGRVRYEIEREEK